MRNLQRLVVICMMLASCDSKTQVKETISDNRQNAKLTELAGRLESIFVRMPGIDVISVEPVRTTNTIELVLKSRDASLDTMTYHELQSYRENMRTRMCRQIVVEDDAGIAMAFTMITPDGRKAFDRLTISQTACK